MSAFKLTPMAYANASCLRLSDNYASVILPFSGVMCEGDVFFDHLVSDADHCRKVRFAVLPDKHSGDDFLWTALSTEMRLHVNGIFFLKVFSGIGNSIRSGFVCRDGECVYPDWYGK